MNYLLDTDHTSLLQRRGGAGFAILSGRLSQLAQDEFAFNIVSFHEQVIGAHAYVNQAKNQHEVIRGYRLLREIIGGFAAALVLDFDANAASEYTILKSQNLRIATMDLRIAAIARSRNLTLLTRNSADFSKVPNLKIEDWTLEPLVPR